MEISENRDATLVFFNADGTPRTNKQTSTRFDDVVYKSTDVSPTKNTRSSRQKPRGTKNLAQKAIVFVALGAGLVMGAHEFKEAMETSKGSFAIKGELGNVVSQNTNTYGFNASAQSPYWDYDLPNIAKDVLDNNKEYDIDTRIYGCYSRLNEYKKDEFMDAVFKEMSKLIGSTPDAYTDEEIKACLHSSFKEYLDSKGISLEDYTKLMEDVIRAYASEDRSQEEIASLLGELNGGSR